MGDQNPWIVENIEAFHFYCCPECDFQSKNGDYFKRHAMESHKKSKVFFLMSKSKNKTNNDFMEFDTESEYQYENEDGSITWGYHNDDGSFKVSFLVFQLWVYSSYLCRKRL